MVLEEKVAIALKRHKKTLSLAESCSGGLLSNRLTNISGISDIFKGAIIAYSDEVKIDLLKVPAKTLKSYGAVSDQVASLLAQNIRKRIKSDFGIGISGIAGPSGGTKQKPVGLVYIAVSTSNETLCLKCIFKGTRSQIKSQAAREALNLLLEFIS